MDLWETLLYTAGAPVSVLHRLLHQGRQPWLPAASSGEMCRCPIQAIQNVEDDVLNPIPPSSSSINARIANKSKTHLPHFRSAAMAAEPITAQPAISSVRHLRQLGPTPTAADDACSIAVRPTPSARPCQRQRPSQALASVHQIHHPQARPISSDAQQPPFPFQRQAASGHQQEQHPATIFHFP
ncbi:hypothetical protein ACLOJK_004126 [Asimina triloba]